MPGPTGPNPSLTIAALADRFADHIIDAHAPRHFHRQPPREEAPWPPRTDVIAAPGTRRPHRGRPGHAARAGRWCRWFDPAHPREDGLRAAISATIGKQADRAAAGRAGRSRTLEPYDFSVDAEGQPREELWLDYVSDLGDGWDSTYAVAPAVARPTLDAARRTGRAPTTREAASVLVFGGDEVYPDGERGGVRGRGPLPALDGGDPGPAPPRRTCSPFRATMTGTTGSCPSCACSARAAAARAGGRTSGAATSR